MGIITLTTDFGTADSYVGAMKGVILSIHPHAIIVDITHAVPAQDICAGAFALMGAVPFYPKGTVHVAVVDPGVGSERRPIAIEAFGHYFVGPDNGVLTLALQENLWRRGPTLMRPGSARVRAFHLTNRKFWLPEVSNTFHGRDVFAPIAAYLAEGMPLELVGEPIDDYVALKLDEPHERNGELIGQIIYIDRFGNLISNIPDWEIGNGQASARVMIAQHQINRISATYSDVARGELLALFGSSGYLEVSVRNGSAAQALSAQVGDEVRLTKK